MRPPVHEVSAVSVLIRPVGDVGFDGADGPVGLQHPQGVVAGGEGLLGDGASLILLGLPGVRTRGLLGRMRGVRLGPEGIGRVHLVAPPPSLHQEPFPQGRGRFRPVLTNDSQLSPLLFEQLAAAHRIKDLIAGRQVQPNALEEAVFSVLQLLAG